MCILSGTQVLKSSTAIIIPDGCRDLIMKVSGEAEPQWFVSPLLDHSKAVQIENNSNFLGFRIKPGTYIEEEKLLNTIKREYVDLDNVYNVIEDFTCVDFAVEEALSCLASDIDSIKKASLLLGVSTRTLQRFIYKKTERTPSYWFQLARIRRAARALPQSVPLVDMADMYGFSDQAHMSREFKRWFHISPSEIQDYPEIVTQLNDIGYG